MKEMIYQLLVGNNRGVSDTLKKLGVRVLDEASLDAYIDLYRDYMRTIDVKSMQQIMSTSATSEIPLQLTDKFVRLIRVYGMLEGSCKAIFPEFNYFDLLDNYIDDLFFDEEFMMYKVSEDVRTLMNSKPSAATPKPIDSKPSTRLPNLDGIGAAILAMYVIMHW
jgi:predicted unusual protein kinase regulating ubiquinone biosynthesis (AarF/ABC1/UbiB family)